MQIRLTVTHSNILNVSSALLQPYTLVIFLFPRLEDWTHMVPYFSEDTGRMVYICVLSILQSKNTIGKSGMKKSSQTLLTQEILDTKINKRLNR